MISTRLINITLDQIAKSNPLADFARNLKRTHHSIVDLRRALCGRNDQIANDLIDAFLAIEREAK